MKPQIDWWDTISEDEKADIEEGIRQADAGQLTPSNEVIERLKKKFGLVAPNNPRSKK